MNNRFPICTFLLLALLSNILAQEDLTILPVSFDVNILDNEVPNLYQFKTTLSNSSEENIKMAWAMTDVDLPEEWETSIIEDTIIFLPHIMSSSEFDPIELAANTEAQDFILNIVFFGQEGCGTINIAFTDFNTGALLETINYSIAINDEDCIEVTSQLAFEFNPSSFDEEYIEDEISIEYIMGGNMTNLSDQELMINWEVIDLDLPTAWNKYVVDINFSYPPIINSSPTPMLIEPNAKEQYFGINIWPNDQAGCGTFKVVFFDHLDSTVIDTIEYSISINNPGCLTTSTLELSSLQYNILPNPSPGFFNLSTIDNISMLEIYSVSGQLIQKISQVQNSFIDLSDFPRGVYVLKILDNYGHNHISKLIKN